MSGGNALAWIKVIGALVAVSVVGWIVYRIWSALPTMDRVTEILTETGENINPLNTNNVINTQVTRAVTAASGAENSLGTWIAGLVYDDEVETAIHGKSVENPWQYEIGISP